MILDGNTHGDGAALARYMQTGKEGEIASVVQFRAPEFFGNDPVQAFASMQGMAEAKTKSTMPFFHGYIQGVPGERLTEAQLLETADRMEKRLGFTGHPRFITTHTDIETGRQNYHVAWFRMDVENERIINPGLYPFRLIDEARKIEKDFGLQIVSSERQPGDRARPGNHAEFDESHRLDTNLKAIRNGILDCFEKSDNGKSFAAAIRAQGMELANGDRRDCFVVIDEAGGHHALNKKLTGMTLAEIRDRLADLDRTQLPSVDQAKEIQQERQHQRAIDRAAEQAMQGAHAEARGRYDAIRPDRTAEQAIQPDYAAAKGRRDEIQPNRYAEIDRQAEQAMQPEIKPGTTRMYRGIGNNVGPSREGDALFFTTDPARAAAFGKLHYVDVTDAELAKFEQPHRKRILDAEPVAKNDWRTADPAIIARINEPVTGARADIRMAWTLSRNDEQLAEALAARGFGLARATLEEAYESERLNAFAKEIGNRAPVVKEGEIVAINGFGSIYRFDERTTGQLRDDIDKRLAGIDPAGLMSIADTAAAMREASHAAWVDRQRVEQEAARPPSLMESRIADIADQAREQGATVSTWKHNGETAARADALADQFRPENERETELSTIHGDRAFSARLDEAGIAIARVTEADVKGLAALREAESLARIAADTNIESHKARHFAADLVAGDLAAVTRDGDVYRINPEKIGDAKQHIAAELPGVIETRARFEIEREQVSALWDRQRTDTATMRQDFAAERESSHQAAETARDVRQFNQEVGAAVDTGVRAGSRFFGGLARMVENFFGFLDSFMPAPPPTRDQAERMAQSVEEQATDRAWREDAARQQAEHEFLLREMERSRQSADQAPTSAELWGTPKPRAQQEREKDRERDYERDW